ncbi:hypothetical protein MtrunA17_Chr8g0368191 [Medicago truncatula]|uniref:Neprosin activation peptide domain-containing protein n=1 Tax=Medicago truncatula TaxID=3880 RepID=A0A396GKI5_MEDTR|nr:hypothetical protein MtrunA17_Chr8g0368191 [Medicago truncatula]
MDSGSIIIYLLLVSFVSPIYSFKTSSYQLENQTFQIEKFHKLKKTIKNRLQQINKPPIKTIQSSDGDIVDCVSVKREETNGILYLGKPELTYIFFFFFLQKKKYFFSFQISHLLYLKIFTLLIQLLL